MTYFLFISKKNIFNNTLFMLFFLRKNFHLQLKFEFKKHAVHHLLQIMQTTQWWIACHPFSPAVFSTYDIKTRGWWHFVTDILYPRPR